MYEANIKKQHLDVFEERLQHIKPHLDRARSIICSNNKRVLKNIYFTGGCAAWLIGRTDTFNDITIYLLSRSLTNQSYKKIFKEYMKCKDTLITHKCVYNLPTLPETAYGNRYVMMQFTYKGTPSIKLVYTYLDIHCVEKWLSDFAALSVFINLYDLNEIRTAECRCSYESNCTVTQNGCVRHSHVVYPLIFDSTDSNALPVDNKLKNQAQLMYIDDMEKELENGKPIFCPKSLYIYPTRLFMDPDLYPNRIMSFCEYSCSKCKDRDKLTRKFIDIWRHKTYAPHGYGCKAAAQRFKGIDTNFFKQYCTCKSLNQIAKRQRCNPPN